jgi:hypothetical protein
MFRKLGLTLGVAIAISAAAFDPDSSIGQVWQWARARARARSLARPWSRRYHLHSDLHRLFRLLHCQTRDRYALRASRAARYGLRLDHAHCRYPGFARRSRGFRCGCIILLAKNCLASDPMTVRRLPVWRRVNNSLRLIQR